MPGYSFQNLSPTDFECLARDVLNRKLGLELQTYPEGRDQGIDLRQVTESGQTIIGQCKHYCRSSVTKLKNAVSKELKKDGYKHAHRYLLITSRPISAKVQSEIAKTLKIPVNDVWGPDRLNDALRDHPGIEQSHFKLWLSSTAVLERVLRAGLWNRTDALLEEAAAECAQWIETPAAREAREILGTKGVCLITGLPGVGKTILAKRLLLEAVAADWQVVQVRSPNDLWDLWKSDIKQIFYYDDFLGQSRLSPTAEQDAPDLLMLLGRVYRERSTKRLVLTSRAQVLREAEQSISDRLQETAHTPSHCVIALDELDQATRSSIVSAHLYFSRLPADEREQVESDRRLTGVVCHPNYGPRVVQQVTQHLKESSTADDAIDLLERTFSNPEKLWRASFEPLDGLTREIVLTLATLPAHPIHISDLHALLGSPDPFEWRRGLGKLEPTWVRIVDSVHERTVRLAHPGCHDYLLALIDHPETALDRLTKVQRIDQVFALSEAAGLLNEDTKPSLAQGRPHLAAALRARREVLASLTRSQFETWAHGNHRVPTRLSMLRDVVMLLKIFGRHDDWILPYCAALVEQTGKLAPSSSPNSLFFLAAGLAELEFEALARREETIQRLVTTGLATARTAHDLIGYELLTNAWHHAELHTFAAERAQSLLREELDGLLMSDDTPDELARAGEQLRERALLYGFDLQLGDLRDRVALLGEHQH